MDDFPHHDGLVPGQSVADTEGERGLKIKSYTFDGVHNFKAHFTFRRPSPDLPDGLSRSDNIPHRGADKIMILVRDVRGALYVAPCFSTAYILEGKAMVYRWLTFFQKNIILNYEKYVGFLWIISGHSLC